MAFIRKLVVEAPISGAERIKKFNANVCSAPGKTLGLLTASKIYWEICPPNDGGHSFLYARDRNIEGGVVKTDGFLCNNFDSADLIGFLGEVAEVYGFMADMDGMLDEGLSLSDDFSLVECIAADDMMKNNQIMMAGESSRECWWVYKVVLSVSAFSKLLNSNVLGYQIGFFVCMKNGGVVRVIREVGCDMQSMDLVLTEVELPESVTSRVVSIF